MVGCVFRLKWIVGVNLQIWFSNVPYTKLAVVKGHQNWVKVDGDHLTFPGGGTQFPHGALHYIDFIQKVSLSRFYLSTCLYVYIVVLTLHFILVFVNFSCVCVCAWIACM